MSNQIVPFVGSALRQKKCVECGNSDQARFFDEIKPYTLCTPKPWDEVKWLGYSCLECGAMIEFDRQPDVTVMPVPPAPVTEPA